MPLHDWSKRSGWEGVHHLWISGFLRWVKPRLPAAYRAYIGSAPVLAVGAPSEKPDVNVRRWSPEDPEEVAQANTLTIPPDPSLTEPDIEIALPTLDSNTTLFIERQGLLVAAVELISPRNKDRPSSRTSSTMRYAGYLLEGVHLLLVDVHPRPARFSFADQIGAELEMKQPPFPTPLAISYRVGEPIDGGGRFLAIWRRPLTIGAPLPSMQLPLTVHQAVPVDLESTYRRAAEDAYLT